MKPISTLTAAAALGALVACSERGTPTTPDIPIAELNVDLERVSTIAFTSTRDDPTGTTLAELILAAEIYLIDAEGTNPRRLTENSDGDILPALSPDGTKIVFESNRRRAEEEPVNTSDLFVMNTHGGGQRWLARGSSGTWSPDGKSIAFHASATGTARPIKGDPGAATFDSDIFVVNVGEALDGVAVPKNITNNAATIDDDPDWSPELPDGQKIVFTSHAARPIPPDNHFNSVSAEIYVINADGTGSPTRLTKNKVEERAPAWSPDGTLILFSCRIGPPRMLGGAPSFEICVMSADRTDLPGCIKVEPIVDPDDVCVVRLTNNDVPDLTANWSPDGEKIVFHRQLAGETNQLWVMNADGTGQAQLTNTAGHNLFANWGELPQRIGPVPPLQP